MVEISVLDNEEERREALATGFVLLANTPFIIEEKNASASRAVVRKAAKLPAVKEFFCELIKIKIM